MRSDRRGRLRRLSVAAAIALAVAAVLVGPRPAGAAAAPLSISITGNHFVDSSGHTIRLLGVNHSGAEYSCVNGYAYGYDHFDDADAAAVASWGADAVRVPLNEDCWLGIKGQPTAPQTQAGYQQEIVDYVDDLNRHGLYAILDLHWSEPGSGPATGGQPMPDLAYSPAFWASVASTFETNRAVVFDLYNEPHNVSWRCWADGTRPGPIAGLPIPCLATADDGTTYPVAGMATLLAAVRDAGSTQPVLLAGLDWANDLGDKDHGQSWLTHVPSDPYGQEAASFHNYMGSACDAETCWNDAIAGVAKHVPVVTGEFDEDNFLESECKVKKPSTFDEQYMDWADAHGVSYLAWGWRHVVPQQQQDADGCHDFQLIDGYSTYAPAKPNGVAVHDHLWALAHPPVTLSAFQAAVRAGNKSVGFTLRSPQTSAGTLAGKTGQSYAVGTSQPHRVALGTVHFTLTAQGSKTVVLSLSKQARKLLVDRRSLKAVITITLTSTGHRRTVLSRAVTLKAR